MVIGVVETTSVEEKGQGQAERGRDINALVNHERSGRRTPAWARLRTGSASSAASSYHTISSALPSLPAESRVIRVEKEENNGLREIVVNIESGLTPIELSTFYTDELVRDWMIYRDTLTEGMGWNGVFLQYGGVERRLGVFSVVRPQGVDPAGKQVTVVSMLLVEAIP